MKIRNFLLRFLMHLCLMISISLFIYQYTYPKTNYLELVQLLKNYCWIPTIAALVTAVITEEEQ